MRADAESLHEGELLEVQLRGRVKFSGWQREQRSHPAINVNAEHLQARAAIWLSPAAGDAVSAIQIWLDRAAVAGAQAVRLRARIDHLDAEFVTENAWVGKEWLPPRERVEIGSAYANAMDANECLTRLRRRLRRIGRDKVAGLFENDLAHD
jgi:hypothetical protein